MFVVELQSCKVKNTYNLEAIPTHKLLSRQNQAVNNMKRNEDRVARIKKKESVKSPLWIQVDKMVLG